jgi:hypothetical protein
VVLQDQNPVLIGRVVTGVSLEGEADHLKEAYRDFFDKSMEEYYGLAEFELRRHISCLM